MKLSLVLFAVTVQGDTCDHECQIDAGNYCEHKGDMIRNKMLYDDAKERYAQQENDYNRLATCYNALKDVGGLIREWDNHCTGSGEPCRNEQGDKRECCITNDWETLKDTTQLVASWASSIDNDFETLENQMKNFLSCLNGACIASF